MNTKKSTPHPCGRDNLDLFYYIMSTHEDVIDRALSRYRLDLNDKDDIRQEIEIAIFKRLRDFKSRPQTCWAGYIYKLSFSKVMNHFREAGTQKRRMVAGGSVPDYMLGQIVDQKIQTPPDELIEDEETKKEQSYRDKLFKLVHWCIEEGPLSPTERIVAKAVFVEGVTCVDLAISLGTTAGSVRLAKSRARKRIVACLSSMLN